jgi:long-chain acyl-CoA synthetase
MANLHSTIFELCAQRGDRPAFRIQKEAGGYRSITWSKYRELSLRLSAYLKSQGVGKGDRVALISENAPEWTMAALAVTNLGGVLVPIAAVASGIEAENTIRGAQPKFCFLSVEVGCARHIRELNKGLGIPTIEWHVQEDRPLSRWTTGMEPLPVDESCNENDVAVLIYTSGTTGSPKGVPITHGNVLANARAVMETIEASGNDRLVSVLPLSHMLEFTGGFVIAALQGASVTYVKSLKPEDLLQALRDTRATILLAVPLLFEVISRNLQQKLDSLPGPLPGVFRTFSDWTRKRPGLGRVFFPFVHSALGGNIRYFVAGGSRLHPQTFDFFRGVGITVLQGYGLTETSPVLTVTSLHNAAPDHVGRAVPGVEVGIFNDDGQPLPVGQEGEIWGRGSSVFKGYLDPEHTKGVFFGEWFRTGDLGTLDSEGCLRITGRKKDIIVTPAGKNVYPEEIEGVVMASGFFNEAAVLGLKDAAGHEKIVLVMVPNRPRFVGKSNEEIRREATDMAVQLTRSLSEYKWPQRIEVFFDDLPKTSTRKIKKHEVRKLLEGNRESKAKVAGGEGTLNLDNALENAIATGISGITRMDPATIRLTDSLSKDLGLDSLTFVELVGQVEKKFNTQIEGVDFGTIVTVKDLVAALGFAAQNAPRFSLFSKVFFVDFQPRDNKSFFWRLPRRMFNLVLRAYLRLRHGLEVEGLENLSSGGPFVFAPNHSSHFDLLSIAGTIAPGLVHKTYAVAAKDYFFNRSWKAFGARMLVNAIPFDRKGRVNESMRMCKQALDQGDSLVIFPEGTRSPTGKLQPFKTGVGQLLASHPRAQAVPVFIDGAHTIMPKGNKFPGPGHLRIRFGKPISFKELSLEPENAKKIAARLRAEVVALSGGKL